MNHNDPESAAGNMGKGGDGPAGPADPVSLCVLGATGSIGSSTLDLVRRNRERFEIIALTAHRGVDKLAALALEFNARLAVIGDESLYGRLKDLLSGSGIEAAAGEKALVEAARRGADITMAGIMGAAGLRPTLAAVREGGRVALANKECLVAAGELFMREVAQSGAVLLPVDSEHSAIFQSLDANPGKTIDRIILTASGGPFRTCPAEDLANVTPAQALAHPNWSMGRKISIDSATMMNKGLELIEAHHLFPASPGQLEVVIHPQSIIHSMVSYIDGSVIAQLGAPDMRTPIAYSLSWPTRMNTPVEKLDLAAISRLDFEPPDYERFPALALAREVLETGGNAPTIMNAANEIAVEAFLQEKIAFMDIAPLCGEVIGKMQAEFGCQSPLNIDQAIEIDHNSRKMAQLAIM